MLSEILKKSTCADCRFCCVFRKESQWETPIFFEDAVTKLSGQFPNSKFSKVGNESYTLDLSDLYTDKPDDYEAPCYFLSNDKGCLLPPKDKPFDCKIWPLMLMIGDDSKLYLVLDPVCDAMNEYSLEFLQNFVVKSNLHRLIFDYEFKHPILLENFHRDFPKLYEYGEKETKDMFTKIKSLKEIYAMKRLIANDLLSIKAVFFRPDEPFIWASGIKSPVYCDNRLTLTTPSVRDDVENGFAKLIKKEYPDCEVLMGTSTAGIAHAAITAHIMNLPMGYVRSGNKDHGRQNRIEGKLEKGQKVVVVEDLISTGGSVIEVVNTLREAGAEVLGIASIFTYNMEKSRVRLSDANVKNVSLTDFDTIAEVAAENNYIKKEDIKRLISFRNNPSDESWIGA